MVTACTNETSAAALGASTSSHWAPTVCPQVPIQLTNIPSQSQRKARCARGAQAEESAAGEAPLQTQPYAGRFAAVCHVTSLDCISHRLTIPL